MSKCKMSSIVSGAGILDSLAVKVFWEGRLWNL